MLAILIAWLAIIFMAFGLCAPANHTVVATLFISALAAAAILLILELERPLSGLISISHAPLRDALNHLGR